MEIQSFEQLEALIREQPAVLAYFYNDSCAPCQVIRPKVKTLVESLFPSLQMVMVNAALHPEITARYEVFSSPTLLVFFEQKEYIRESKHISMDGLEEKIGRYYGMVFGE